MMEAENKLVVDEDFYNDFDDDFDDEDTRSGQAHAQQGGMDVDDPPG